MDIRIVNTCNNNCLYCLESSLRNKEKYISSDYLFTKISAEKNKENITFFWGNPLLHPDLNKLIKFSKNNWFSWVWLLSNSGWLTEEYLNKLIINWLTTFWIYFNSFNKKNHELVNWWWITYEKLLENIKILSSSWINIKIIIHINKINIWTVARDLIILNKKYWINNFDFVNYFPFDKPYENRKYLEYNFENQKNNISLIFNIIKKYWLKTNFMKFSKDFFKWFEEFYDYERWIINQIWEEDLDRLSLDEKPFCYKENRCEECFIKDNCKYLL